MISVNMCIPVSKMDENSKRVAHGHIFAWFAGMVKTDDKAVASDHALLLFPSRNHLHPLLFISPITWLSARSNHLPAYSCLAVAIRLLAITRRHRQSCIWMLEIVSCSPVCVYHSESSTSPHTPLEIGKISLYCLLIQCLRKP